MFIPTDLLPPIPQLRARTRALAALDAILCPEWEYRYYSYNSRWGGAGEEMASMRNGQGDDWFLLFDSVGAAIKGVDRERCDAGVSRLIQEQVPAAFASFLKEPAFSMDRASFCYWRSHLDHSWHRVTSGASSPDGSAWLLALLIGDASAYQQWAQDYYESRVSLPLVASVFRLEPITEQLVRGLNPDVSLDAVASDLEEICYAFKDARAF